MIGDRRLPRATKALLDLSQVHRFRTFVKLDSAGLVIDYLRSMDRPPSGWVEITDHRDCDLLMTGVSRYTVEVRPDGSGALKTLPKVRLTVNDPVFITDGVDAAEIMVLEAPLELGPVQVLVNGVRQSWSTGEVHEIVLESKASVVVTVKLVDPRVYADPDTLLIRGYPPEGAV